MSGLPVVVTNVGQCAEVVDHGKFGLLVEPGNPDELAHALMHLLSNHALRSALGQQFKKRVQQLYGEGTFMDNYIRLLSQ